MLDPNFLKFSHISLGKRNSWKKKLIHFIVVVFYSYYQ